MASLPDQLITQLDGCYLSDTDLVALQTFAKSYPVRLKTYNTLREKSDELILNSLRQLMRSHRHVVQSHGNVCKRDMEYILRHIAIGILKADTESFVEFILWMESTMKALKKTDAAIRAYQALQSAIRSSLPEEMVVLIDPYVGILLKGLLSGSNLSA